MSLLIPIRPLGHEIVHVKMGKELKDFGIHKTLICHHSSYFKAAFTSGFHETSSGVMTLPDTKVEVFELFYNWLYYQKLYDEDDDKDTWPSMHYLLELHVFADMARMIPLKNQTLSDVLNIGHVLRKSPMLSFSYLWKNTSANSQARRLVVDWMVWKFWAKGCSEKMFPQYQLPQELLYHVLGGMSEIVTEYEEARIGKKQCPLRTLGEYDEVLGPEKTA